MTERRYQYAHGTRSQYTTGRCRCPLCRRANAEYMAHRRAELRAEAATPMHAHGLPAGGTYYCCPCGDCRTTANDRKRTWRAGRTTHTEAIA